MCLARMRSSPFMFSVLRHYMLTPIGFQSMSRCWTLGPQSLLDFVNECPKGSGYAFNALLKKIYTFFKK